MILNTGRWLEHRLRLWRDAGVIDRRQADAIRAFERGQPGLGAFAILAGIGGVCVAAGIILLIAYNWEAIPRAVRIGGFLMLLAGSAEAALRLMRQRPQVSVALQLLWLLLPLAGIGLWGQIYQLSGDPLRPLIVWLTLSLPAVWIWRSPPAAFIHTTGVAVACFVGAFSDGTLLSVRVAPQGWFWWIRGAEGDGRWTPGLAPSLAGLGVLWTAAWFQARTLLAAGARSWLILAMLAFLWCLTLFATPFRCSHLADQALVTSLLTALFWGVCAGAGLERKSWEMRAIELTGLMLYGLTFFWHASPGELMPSFDLGSGWFIGVLAVIAIGLTGSADFSAQATSRRAGWMLKAFALSPALLCSLFLFNDWTRLAVSGSANLVLIAFAVWLILEGIQEGEEGKVNLGVAEIGVLIVTRLFDVFRTLLTGGLGFIATGLGLIALGWVLNRGRQRLLAQAMEARR